MSPHAVQDESDNKQAKQSGGRRSQQNPTSSAGYSLSVDVSRPFAEHAAPSAPSAPEIRKVNGGDSEDDDEPAPAVAVPKKKRKSRKSKKKSTKPTGFEENYADAPVTPEEFKEEANDIYHQSRGFAERIESCIQRYRARRRFDSERKDVFDKYLTLGGVDTGPKMFGGGLDPDTLAERDAGQISDLVAIDRVGSDKYDASTGASDVWTVDFVAVAKCFFSSLLPAYFDLENADRIHYCVNIVRNFLNYVLHHNVCPEYTDQVYAARAVCDLADKELVAAKDASAALPGDFNVACSTLSGGHYQGLYCAEEDWAKELSLVVGMSDKQARRVIGAALTVVHGVDATAEQMRECIDSLRLTASRDIAVEVVECVRADDDTKAAYKARFGADVKPVGRLRTKRWFNPWGPQEDYTDDEEEEEEEEEEEDAAEGDDGTKGATGKEKGPHAGSGGGGGPRRRRPAILNGEPNWALRPSADDPADAPYEFLVEDDVLALRFVGMKMDVKMRELTFPGIVAAAGTDVPPSQQQPMVVAYIDAVYNTYCSFYTNLPNEMMYGWKKPEPLTGDERELRKAAQEAAEGEEEGAEAIDLRQSAADDSGKHDVRGKAGHGGERSGDDDGNGDGDGAGSGSGTGQGR